MTTKAADSPDVTVLGIDFGTSYSSAGALLNGKIELVRDDGDAMIPTVVHLPARGEPTVGHRALAMAATDPSCTVTSVKRLLAATEQPNVPYPTKFVNGRLVLSAGGRDYAVEQVAAAVLSRLRELAERRFGGRIESAVFAIPAGTTDAYVAALKRAARLAHLEVAKLVAEPIAGALALGLHHEPARRRLLVCDFGGGTFDVTAVQQDQQKFAPVATRGDSSLGGDDLDAALASAIAGMVYRRSSYDMLGEYTRRMTLTMRCEAVKRALSTAKEARLHLREAFIEKGVHRDLDVLLDRAYAEPLWQPLVERAIDCVKSTLAAARWAPTDVDRVVLIGGGSMVPLFRAAMARAVPEDRIATTPLAGVAVAMGATALAGSQRPPLPTTVLRGLEPATDDNSIHIDFD